MREALMQIKNELGEEAIILKTRKLPRKVFPLGSQEEVEVTAAIDESVTAQPHMAPISMASTGVYRRPKSASSIIDPDSFDAPVIRTWEPPRTESPQNDRMAPVPRRENDRREQREMMELKENVRELQGMVKGILTNSTQQSTEAFTGGWAVLNKKLIESEVRESVAGELLRQLDVHDGTLNDLQATKKFTAAMATALPVSGPLKLKKHGPLVVTFIGPTGSGKTTTLAKLAAHCCINKKKKVSIITADTYRIAAIEQIRMFADIIKVNIQVVFSPEEIGSVIRECSNDDIILVDTAGRSQRNHEHMDDLRLFMTALHSDEVHLVLSATTKDSDLIECINRYKPLGVNRLLFTKLDETGKVGNILNSVYTCKIPVSYLTTGQSVPDDIELAHASRFTERLFEGSPL